MTKNVVAATHDYQDHGNGIYRVGTPPSQAARPLTILTANNPNLAALQSAYPTSDFRARNNAEAAGAGYNNYTSQAMAIGYTLEQDAGLKASLGAAAVAALDTEVARQEALIEDYVTNGNLLAMQGSYPDVAYNSWLYAYVVLTEIAYTFDHCYDLLTESQKTRWYKFAMQAGYNMLNPTNGAWHALNGSSRDLVGDNTWAVNPPFPTSNYHCHITLAVLSLALAFEGEVPITLPMQSGNVDLDGDYFLNEYNTVHLPVKQSKFAILGSTGGGSMEGLNYGLFTSDLYLIKNIYQWSKGSNIYAGVIDSYLEKTVDWAFHAALPNKTNVVSVGAHPNNEIAQIRLPYAKQLNYSMACFPSAAISPAVKLLASQIRDMILNTSDYLDTVFEFIHSPIVDSVVAAANFDGVPLVYAAEKAGDIFLRNSFDADGIVVHLRCGEVHGGTHSHGDATAIQVYKNGHLIVNTGVNNTNGDFDLGSPSSTPSLDRNDRQHLSLVGVGTLHDWYPDANSIALELTDYNPDVQFALDNSVADGEVFASVDGARAFQSRYPQMQRINRQTSMLIEGVIVIFDRVITDNAEDITLQFNMIYDPVINGSSFTVDNGVSSLEATILSHSPTWTKAVPVIHSDGFRLGDGSWQTRAVIGNASSMNIVTVLNIDGASTGAVLDSSVAGQHTVTVTLAGGGTKSITFFESMALRSIA